jgi:perosamine synthetase
MPPRRALGEAEQAIIQDVIAYYRERGLDPGYQSEFERRYTEAFVEQMGGGYADAVATGTAALFVALAALELPPGSEVIVSPITDPGSISAIILNGLVPRLADAKPGSYALGVEQFVSRVTPNVRGVMVVHSIGQPAEISEIVEEAHARGIRVIEDCSQSHGAKSQGRPIGTFGDIAAFSAMYRKAHIAGGSGGVVYSRDLDLHRKALAHADRGKPRWAPEFSDYDPATFLFPALNLHTDELSCGIGLVSLRRLQDTIRRRLKFVAEFTDLMHDRCTICTPYGYSECDSPFIYPVIVDPERITCTKLEFAQAVLAEGIGLNPHYRYVVSEWPWVKPYLADEFDTPNARDIRNRSFCLYLNENYGAAEAADCVSAISKIEGHFGK